MAFGWFKKRRRAVSPLAAEEILAAVASGKPVCRRCGERCGRGRKSSLETITCGGCDNPNVVAPLKLSSFWLYEFIDFGGMGIVYRAVSAEYPGESFAVKLLHADHCSADTVEALMNEARILRKFEGHPNIVQAVEVGELDGAYFFVTEFIDGERLDHRVERDGAYSPGAAVDLALELLRIDKFIWSFGFLYRDLKPENILLRGNKCTLIDFGLCIGQSDAYAARNPEVDGAPHFMPPERLAGEPEGVYSETYSIGMILYYALMGRTLFPSGEAQTVAETYLTADRSAPELDSVPNITPELEATVRKAIGLQIPGRYQSFDRLESDLRACRKALQ